MFLCPPGLSFAPMETTPTLSCSSKSAPTTLPSDLTLFSPTFYFTVALFPRFPKRSPHFVRFLVPCSPPRLTLLPTLAVVPIRNRTTLFSQKTSRNDRPKWTGTLVTTCHKTNAGDLTAHRLAATTTNARGICFGQPRTVCAMPTTRDTPMLLDVLDCFARGFSKRCAELMLGKRQVSNATHLPHRKVCAHRVRA